MKSINILPIFIGFVLMGCANGEVKEYDNNGALVEVRNYKDNKLHGKNIMFQGMDTFSISYYNEGIIQSDRFFYEGNLLKAEHKYVNGKKNGIGIVYHKNGQVKIKANYDGGWQQGLEECFYKTGVLKFYGQYFNDAKHGQWKYYDDKGKLTNEEEWDKGMLISEKEYD